MLKRLAWRLYRWILFYQSHIKRIPLRVFPSGKDSFTLHLTTVSEHLAQRHRPSRLVTHLMLPVAPTESLESLLTAFREDWCALNVSWSNPVPEWILKSDMSQVCDRTRQRNHVCPFVSLVHLCDRRLNATDPPARSSWRHYSNLSGPLF